MSWNTSEIVYDEEGNAIDLIVTRDERTTEVEFAIEGDVITMLHSEGASPMTQTYDDFNAPGLGCYYTDDLMCLNYLDWKTVFTNKGEVEVLPVIDEQPEGTLVMCTRSGNSLALVSYYFWAFVEEVEQEGKVAVVLAPDGMNS